MPFAASAPAAGAPDHEEIRALVRLLDDSLAAAWREAIADGGGPPGASPGWGFAGGSLREAVDAVPQDPRLASLWREALHASGTALAGGPDAAAEGSDAIRLLGALCDDPLGGRFAPAWLLRSAMEPGLSPEKRNDYASAARRLSAPGSATARWGRTSEIAAAVAAGDIDRAIDAATVAASVEGPDDAFDALTLAVRALGGALPEGVLRRAVTESPKVVAMAAGLPGARLFRTEFQSAQAAARDTWLLRCRTIVGGLDALDAYAVELRLRFGNAAPGPTGPRESLDPADLSAEDLAAWCSRLETFAGEARESLAGWLEAEGERIARDRARLARFLSSLAQDLQGWDRQVAGIEREAEESGIALHDFGLYSPFQWKRRRRAAAFRAHHEECVTNRDQAKSLLESNERRIAVELAALDARAASISEFQARLTSMKREEGSPSSARHSAGTPVL